MIDTATKYKQSSDLRGWPRGAESATLKGGHSRQWLGPSGPAVSLPGSVESLKAGRQILRRRSSRAVALPKAVA